MKLSTLSSIFNAAVFGLAGIAVALSMATGGNLPDTSFIQDHQTTITCTVSEAESANPAFILKRGLTSNEDAFYSRFFGDKLNTDGVCISLYTQNSQLAADVPEGEANNIHIYGELNYAEDYAQESNPFLFGMLAYEMTHLMQHQQGTHENEPDISVSSEYKTLYGELDLAKYTDGEQRGLISDYVRFIFHPTSETSQLQNFATNPCNAQSLLRNTVERAFPGAKEMRHEHQNRHLTDSEKALIYGIFGNQIDHVDQMTIRQRAQCNDDAAATVFGGEKTDFHVWTQQHHEDDYTEGDLFNYGLLVHETVHLWQNQHHNNQTGGNGREYAYPVDTQKWDFQDYHVEQQGSIIEDYARYFLNHSKDTRQLPHSQHNLAGLKEIVENQFPTAKLTREYFEAHGELPDLGTVKSWITPYSSLQNTPQPSFA